MVVVAIKKCLNRVIILKFEQCGNILGSKDVYDLQTV